MKDVRDILKDFDETRCRYLEEHGELRADRKARLLEVNPTP